MEFERINPLTGGIASTAAAMQPSDIPAIAARAAAAFSAWAAMGPNARRTVLMKAATALEARADAFVEAMMGEIGATKGWALFNLGLAASMVREAAALTTQIAGEVIPSDKPGCLAMALKEPVGVILGIAPWNAPIILGVRAIAVPLACGNSVILKASESCPRTHELIVEAFAEGGFPDGVVNIVTNAPADAGEVVGALIDAPEVKRINFTGSTAVGKIIARRAAGHLKPCLLELGGKAPLIVLANDSAYGLSAAVFTRDTARGLGVARQIRSGICHVNGPTVHDEAQMPFGGVGASGYGRFGGRQGIDSFTETRWITIETQPGHFPI
ncbi:aldehyde dehydrogenase family protein [Sphingopyxis sp.]|uniref:aldehyde dehydrogenase family protein n=1 Tax=Sphingopyxis sp. TaxID=1908224 RepID=UPI002FCBD28F